MGRYRPRMMDSEDLQRDANKRGLITRLTLPVHLILSLGRFDSSALLPFMAPPMWTTKEQLEFLIEEDVKWAIIKDSGGTLKSFYLQMARTFLEKWPSEDLTQTPEAIESQLQIVSVLIWLPCYAFSLFAAAYHKLVHQSTPSKEGTTSSLEAGP
jgi:hypothetical protein